jgi:hypothetical protein
VTTVTPPAGVLRRAWNIDKPLTLVGLAMAAVLVAAVVGLVIDRDVITGAPAWMKPAKFAISVAIYSFTFLWLLTFITGHRRLVRAMALVTAVAFAIEMVIIVGAAAADTTSHFNVSTPTHAALWSIMAAAIVCVWMANLVVGVMLLRQRLADRALAWALRLGIAISAVGMGVAFFMTSPTAEQISAAHVSGNLPTAGAHSVGVPDGGPGLPFLGWSTVGGDLRVAHFIGLHALQALPLLGILLAKFGPAWLRQVDRVRLIVTAGLSYLAIVVLTTLQALRGQPLVKPDALTATAFVVIILAAAVAVGTIVAASRRADVRG